MKDISIGCVPDIQNLSLSVIYLYILNTNIIYPDLYRIYIVIKYKYVGVTEERVTLAVVHQSRLDHHLPSLDQSEGPHIFLE
jgi:hypothetical protein